MTRNDKTLPRRGIRHLVIALTLLCVAGLLALPQYALAQNVTRGPYLQMGTEDSIIVRWRTNTATQSVVRYGPRANQLDMVASTPGTTTNHEVEVSLLERATRYFYSVGTQSQTLAGGDADHKFKTAPRVGAEKATRIWVIGDSGTANSSARAVRDAYLNFTGSRRTDLWLMLGDNAYDDGTDSEYQAAVFNTYPSLLRQTPVWPTLGNHDARSANSSSQTGTYYNVFTLPKNGEAGGLASGTEAYYSFDHANIHFIVLDSMETSRSPTGAMMTWLRDDLLFHDQPWVIAFWHHPPYSKGSHNSDSESQLREMRQNALPILEAGGVDLVLGGHSHSYERSYLIDGHYGTSSSFNAGHQIDDGDGREAGDGAYEKSGGLVGDPNQGAVYIVAGNAGKISGGSLNHAAMFLSSNRLGSVVLDVDGGQLDATFLDNTGVVRDSFTIIKEPALPVVNVVASDARATEAGRTEGAFKLSRSGDTSEALRVRYKIQGSATPGADYAALSGSLRIPAGKRNATVTVKPVDDSARENDETVVLKLSDDAAYARGTALSATVTIENDDGVPLPPKVKIAAVKGKAKAKEKGPVNGKLKITRKGDTTSPLTVRYQMGGTAKAGKDYKAPGGSATIAAGKRRANIKIKPIADRLVEKAETVVAKVLADSKYRVNGRGKATVTIISDNAGPKVKIKAMVRRVAEQGQQSGKLKITRKGDTSAPLTVRYSVGGTATAGADYKALGGTKIIAAGERSAMITITPSDDALAEADEKVVVTLSPDPAYLIDGRGKASVKIESDDTAPPPQTTLRASSVFDNKNRKTYVRGGSEGSAPLDDINSSAEEYEVEVESGASFWWEIRYQDPAPALGNPTGSVATIDYRPEESWSGTFTAEFRVGATVLASAALPVDSRKDGATGKGRKGHFAWDLSSAVNTSADLADGRIRLINRSSNGKKIWATQSFIAVTPGQGGS